MITPIAIVVDPNLIYLILGSIFSLNAALLGWILSNLVNIRGRMHRLEARETFVDANFTEVKNRLNDLFDELLPHSQKRSKA